jgi:pyruvate/2-oxoglutarate dehydrogenase complex dihydrolipoamide acyltransferase (E2) component
MSDGLKPVQNVSAGKRLAVASYAAPHEGKIFGTIEIDASEALRFLERPSSAGLTMTHLVVRAAALALRDHVPELNRLIKRGQLYDRPTIDIFLSVALRRGREITGFKVERADTKSLHEIANEIKTTAVGMRRGGQAGVARAQKTLEASPPILLRPVLQVLRFLVMDAGVSLKPLGLPDDPFGSILVTEIGSYGLDVGYPALLPLSNASCIVAIGRVTEKPVVRDGEVVARPILPLSATFDHRVADAFEAGGLVKAARMLLEEPSLLEV